MLDTVARAKLKRPAESSGHQRALTITAAIVHWNTVYLDRAVHHLRARGAPVPNDLLAHVAPLGWEHIGLTGDYVWSGREPEVGFRSLRDVRTAFLPKAA